MKPSNCIIVLLIICYFCSCQQNLHNRRIEVIQESIEAFSQYDTAKLYKLVDTSYYFSLYGKEGFLFYVKNLNERFKGCQTKINYNALKANVGPVNTQEYVLHFCRTKNNEIVDSSFDVTFRFADFQNVNTIMNFEVDNLYQHKKLVPNLPL